MGTEECGMNYLWVVQVGGPGFDEQDAEGWVSDCDTRCYDAACCSA